MTSMNNAIGDSGTGNQATGTESGPERLRATGTDNAGVSPMNTLDQIADLVRNCTDCPLSEGRTNAVPGEGNPQAEVMFIGEGPGFQEDRQGRPFVGPAGKLLDGLLASIGTNREDVYIANVVKCRPPDNRDPTPSEMAACTKYLDRQIELVNPKLIVTLGRFAFGRYFPGEGITKARGRLREKDGRSIFPVLHPAAVLRREELRPTMIDDFKAISEILEGGMELGGSEMDSMAPEAPQPAQLSFVDAPGGAAVPTAPAETSTVSVEEAPRPEQLSLF